MMKDSLNNMMKQAQQIQQDIQKAKQELENITVTGTAGGDMVKIVMLGNHSVKNITIDPSLLNEDKDMLEDLLIAAFNNAVDRLDKISQEKMSGLTAGIPLPAGMKLPF